MPYSKYTRIKERLQKIGITISTETVRQVLKGKRSDQWGIIAAASTLLKEHEAKVKAKEGKTLRGRMAINIMPNCEHRIPTHHKITDHLIRKGLLWKTEIVWNKNNYNASVALGSWKSPSSPYFKYVHEFVLIFCKGTIKKKGRRKTLISPKTNTLLQRDHCGIYSQRQR